MVVQQTSPGPPHASHSDRSEVAMQLLPELQAVPQHGWPVEPHGEQTPATHHSSVSTHCSPAQQGSPVVPHALDAASGLGSPESSADVPVSTEASLAGSASESSLAPALASVSDASTPSCVDASHEASAASWPSLESDPDASGADASEVPVVAS
jgi:hypothetical protein